jgi:hypothetical protein
VTAVLLDESKSPPLTHWKILTGAFIQINLLSSLNMNIGLQYIHTCKRYKETPCVAILNKQKCHPVFFYKVGEQESRTGPDWGDLIPVGGGGGGERVEERDYGAEYCVHVCKCKDETSRNGGKGDKGE